MLKNAISIDVEEYFHATNFTPYLDRTSWDTLPSRVVEYTSLTLDLLERYHTKGTFFVLGYVAEKHPELVRRIVTSGHELASHGYNHQLVYDLTPDEFLRDISDSKKLLEDISGVKVLGYRAPNFSITNRSEWAYDKILEAGYVYDASLYPVKHPRYSNADKPTVPHVIYRGTQKLFVFPSATVALKLFSKEVRLGVAGGAYWRILPASYSNWGLSRINNVDKQPFVCYFHPWEFDFQQPRIKGPTRLTQFRHLGGTSNFLGAVTEKLEKFPFTTIRELAKTYFGSEAGKIFSDA